MCLSTPLLRHLDLLELRRPLTATRRCGSWASWPALTTLTQSTSTINHWLQQPLAALEQAGRVQLVLVKGVQHRALHL